VANQAKAHQLGSAGAETADDMDQAALRRGQSAAPSRRPSKSA
jgi:hypothetical protein